MIVIPQVNKFPALMKLGSFHCVNENSAVGIPAASSIHFTF
jgi:hypothetical protein